jgi:hypothetical protein
MYLERAHLPVSMANGPSLWYKGERSCEEQANNQGKIFCWLLAAQGVVRASAQALTESRPLLLPFLCPPTRPLMGMYIARSELRQAAV